MTSRGTGPSRVLPLTSTVSTNSCWSKEIGGERRHSFIRKIEVGFSGESRLCQQFYEPLAIFKLWSQWIVTRTRIETKHYRIKDKDQFMLVPLGKFTINSSNLQRKSTHTHTKKGGKHQQSTTAEEMRLHCFCFSNIIMLKRNVMLIKIID